MIINQAPPSGGGGGSVSTHSVTFDDSVPTRRFGVLDPTDGSFMSKSEAESHEFKSGEFVVFRYMSSGSTLYVNSTTSGYVLTVTVLSSAGTSTKYVVLGFPMPDCDVIVSPILMQPEGGNEGDGGGN